MSALGTALERLRGHATHVELVKTNLREAARLCEELADMSRHNAEAATRAATGPEPAPMWEGTRREALADRARLLERSAVLGEIASALRCELAVLGRRPS